MKAETLFQNLVDVVEKLGIQISVQNLKQTPSIIVKSGCCRVKGQERLIIDKNLPIHSKNRIIAACLINKPIDTIYIIPAVREYLESVANKKMKEGGP
jgi:hypothetical protein